MRTKTEAHSFSAARLLLWVVGLAALTLPGFSETTELWQSGHLGNIFIAGKDAVEIRRIVDADSVKWTVTDFWGHRVESGDSRVRGGVARIKPRVSAVGYYLLKASALRGGTQGRERYTSFAIVRAHASPDPVSSHFGVVTHFAQGMTTELLPTLKQIGIESVRDEHYWAEVEPTPGVYSFPAKSDDYMAASRAAGIDPLVVLSYGNKHYDDPEGPSTLAGFEGFANYGRAVLDRYGQQIRWLEVWNEYNGSWAPPPARKDLASRSQIYTAMLKVAYERIKASRPDVQVLGGAAVLVSRPYFERIFKLGGLDYMDALAIHPYRNHPEGVDREVESLNELVRKYNGGKTKPIWATETGCHTREEYDWEKGLGLYEKGRAEAARYLVRQYTLLLKAGVAKIYWYLAADHGDFVGMGLLRHHQTESSGMGRYAVAPAYVSYANLIHQLDRAAFVRREAERPYTRAHVYLFRQGGGDVRVAWATRPAKIRLTTGGPLSVFDLIGAPGIREPLEGAVTLELGQDPIFIRGAVSRVEEIDTGPRVLASTLDDYSNVQGGNNWRYGYLDSVGAFTELTQRETMWNDEWGTDAAGLGYLRISSDELHPDKNDAGDAAVTLRWKSPVEGRVTVGGWIKMGEGGAKGDGVLLRVFVDGRELLSRAVGGSAEAATTFALPATVKPGSLIDFAVSPGVGELYDATRYEFTVTEAP